MNKSTPDENRPDDQTETRDENRVESGSEQLSKQTTAPGQASWKHNKSLHKRRSFSSLLGRILAVNIIPLGFLVGSVMYLDNYRTGLINARLTDLIVESRLIAGALGEAASTGPDGQNLDIPAARQILRRLVAPTQTRARLFDHEGQLIADSREMMLSQQVFMEDLMPPSFLDRILNAIDHAYEFIDTHLPGKVEWEIYLETPHARANEFPEVISALNGYNASQVRITRKDSLIMSVAVPVQRFRRVLGALLITADTKEIEAVIRDQRLSTLQFFSISLALTLLLSVFLTRTIARPVSQLADAADHVRLKHGQKVSIPDFTSRRDEIGELSGALRDMTEELYDRIEAIERFASDVAHEIKNPLTSLRSAVETASRLNDMDVQKRLMTVIQNDVKRMDRLISDISAASRLDAELLRENTEPISLANLLRTLTSIYHNMSEGSDIEILLHLPPKDELIIQGGEGQLGQVFRNLIDNARSFSPSGGKIDIHAKRSKKQIEITLDDEGPGIPEGKFDEIFHRFYSERPKTESFGQHSGLGLSICRQIIEAYGGTIEARNRISHERGGKEHIIGARFTVRLPV